MAIDKEQLNAFVEKLQNDPLYKINKWTGIQEMVQFWRDGELESDKLVGLIKFVCDTEEESDTILLNLGLNEG